jgi:hypothetical protein
MDMLFDRVASGGTRVVISFLCTALALFLYLLLLVQVGKVFGSKIFEHSAGQVLVPWGSAGICVALSLFPPFFRRFNTDPIATSLISIILAAPIWFYFCIGASCGLLGDCL